jgi:hypothetical protein
MRPEGDAAQFLSKDDICGADDRWRVRAAAVAVLQAAAGEGDTLVPYRYYSGQVNENLELAYSLTVHRSQGSDFETVFRTRLLALLKTVREADVDARAVKLMELLRCVTLYFHPKRKWTETKLDEEQSGLTFNHSFETNGGTSFQKACGTGRGVTPRIGSATAGSGRS